MQNNQLVLNILKKNTKGLTAYEILSRLQKIKFVQPMTIYRSLKKLIDQGLIHKSNHKKTFHLCNSGKKYNHNPALAICKDCGSTEELNPKLFSKVLKHITSKRKYNFSHYELEISTLCKECA
jgi:Fur family zinc uptake transcriptional regulator